MSPSQPPPPKGGTRRPRIIWPWILVAFLIWGASIPVRQYLADHYRVHTAPFYLPGITR